MEEGYLAGEEGTKGQVDQEAVQGKGKTSGSRVSPASSTGHTPWTWVPLPVSFMQKEESEGVPHFVGSEGPVSFEDSCQSSDNGLLLSSLVRRATRNCQGLRLPCRLKQSTGNHCLDIQRKAGAPGFLVTRAGQFLYRFKGARLV